MSRVKYECLESFLQKKKEAYQIRVTTRIKGELKNVFLKDCISRNLSEAEMTGHIIDVYYTVINKTVGLTGKEPNEIKKYIMDNIKFE